VVGDLTASNIPASLSATNHAPAIDYGLVTWSGGSDTLIVPAIGCTSSDVVIVTPANTTLDVTEIEYASAGTDQFEIHLSAANTSNDLVFSYVVYDKTL